MSAEPELAEALRRLLSALTGRPVDRRQAAAEARAVLERWEQQSSSGT